MSAVLAPESWQARPDARASRPTLRQVSVNPMRASRMVFMIVLLGVLAAGMVGVLLLNTAIQERETAVSHAQRQADALGYQQAALTAQVEQLRSSSDLATKAWAMGLRPNPYPAFIKLDANGGGSVVGVPTRVTGSEMADQQYRSADDVTKAIEASRADHLAKIAAAKQAAAEAAAQKKAAAQAAAQASAAAKATPAAQPSGARASTTPRASATASSGTGGH